MSNDPRFKIVSISGARVGFGETIAGPDGVPHTLKYYFEPTIEVQCELDSPDEELPLDDIFEYLLNQVKGAVKKQVAADRLAVAKAK